MARSRSRTTAPAPRRRRAIDPMRELVTAFWLSQLVFVAAKLGLADELARGPLAVDVLARRVGAHAPSLRRVLRALASRGVFAETAGGGFALTPLGARLRSDVPDSYRNFALMIVERYSWEAWGDLLHGVRTGALPFAHVHGQPLFDWLHAHPDHERTFAGAMADVSGSQSMAVARAYDFNRLSTLVDVGGAHGHLLAAILRRHRRVRGVLFDQPQVVEAAEQSGFLRDLAGRCEFRAGSFFDGVPAGADGYLMKYILHDWADEPAVTILRRCRDAMLPGGRVLVVEHVVRPGSAPDLGKLLDINMLVLTGGQERTRAEFAALFERAGLRLRRVVPTTSTVSVVEAVRA